MERVLAAAMRPMLFALLLASCGGADEVATESGDIAMNVAPLTTVARGSNTFTVRVDHPHAVELEATLWMPSMGHGAGDPRVVKVDDRTYRLEDVVFSMPGTWDIRMRVACTHGIATRTFRYEVP